MEYNLEPISSADREQIIDIFNYYVENTFAAYPEVRVPYNFFDIIMGMSHGYPTVVAKDKSGNVLGFGMLRPYNPMPAFSSVAELTCFISLTHTRAGLGTAILEHLISNAKKKEIRTILANISSRNTGSIAFHERQGFKKCGCFREIGRKRGEPFDVIWMQKMI